MFGRTLAIGWLTLVVSVVVACQTPPGRIVGEVTRVETVLEPAPDGSLRIRESITLTPEAAGEVRFRRDVSTNRADQLVVAAVTVDGVPVPPGPPLRLTALAPTRVRVEWDAAGLPVSPHVLMVEYRAAAGVAVTQPQATVSWPVLSAGRGFDVGTVVATLMLPNGTAIYPGTGIEEPGWTVTRTPTGITATRSPVPDTESATLVAAFDFNRQGVADPVWERNRDRQRQFLPAFLAAALFFVVIGAGTLIMLRVQYPSTRTPAAAARAAPPSATDREVVVRGLRLTGLVGLAVSLACAAVAATTLAFLGPWLQVIPGTMLAVSVIFLATAPWFRR